MMMDNYGQGERKATWYMRGEGRRWGCVVWSEKMIMVMHG